jgi:Mn2+/Fe2+ NRAMP family transporter
VSSPASPASPAGPPGVTGDADRASGDAGRTRGRIGLLALLGPGIVVAATGVGAGDLATATLAGSKLGTAVLWAVIVGALFKFVVNEGLARWQLATGATFLEGVVARFGPVAVWLFLPYLALWTFFVGAALMGACGVTVHAMVPIFDDAGRGKLVFGAAASVLGYALVRAGGYALLEKVMSACIAVMFATVLVTAVALWPGTGAVLRGLVVPSIPHAGGQGLGWTVALIGGVGGTLTVLCYGYWIREKGRSGPGDLRLCRLDLGMGYVMTAFFGLAMVIIGSTVTVEGKGAGLIVSLANRLEGELGSAGKWAFLAGAFSTVFSSMLGVWQSVPYLFADLYHLARARSRAAGAPARPPERLEATRPYRVYLLLIALVPMLGLVVSFQEIQKLYAIIGAFFLPALAAALLYFNRASRLGRLRNRLPSIVVLAATLLFFGWIALQGGGGE